MPDVTCLKEKKKFVTSEPWAELLITVFLLLMGRAELRWALCQLHTLLALLQEDLQSPKEPDVGGGESGEKRN